MTVVDAADGVSGADVAADVAGADVEAVGEDLSARFRSWWVGVIATLIASTLIITIASDAADARAKLVAGLACTGLLGWRLVVGRGLAPGPADTRRVLYVAGLAAILALAFTVSPVFMYLLYVLLPEVLFVFDHLRPAAFWCAVLALEGLVAQRLWVGWWDANVPVYGAYLSMIAVSIGFALAMFVGYTLMEGRRRAELLAELRASRARIAELDRAAGALAERERLSRDIHDTVGQGLTSILLLLQAAETAASTDPAKAADHVRAARQAAHDNLAETRSIVAALRPVPLDGSTLRAALGRVVNRFAEARSTQTAVNVTGTEQPLDPAMEATLLRIGQELMANAFRHGRPQHVEVTLRYTPTSVLLEVADDGVGFDPALAHAAGRGYGLESIRDRVEAWAGRLQVDSAPGAGTRVRLELDR